MKRESSAAFELDALTRTRLHLAGQIAAGLASNPQNMIPGNWRASIARDALDVADKLISLTVAGGL